MNPLAPMLGQGYGPPLLPFETVEYGWAIGRPHYFVSVAEHQANHAEAQHAFLAELLRLDPDATQRFHDRLLELERRFDAWKDADIENEIKAIWWRVSDRCGVELRR